MKITEQVRQKKEQICQLESEIKELEAKLNTDWIAAVGNWAYSRDRLILNFSNFSPLNKKYLIDMINSGEHVGIDSTGTVYRGVGCAIEGDSIGNYDNVKIIWGGK